MEQLETKGDRLARVAAGIRLLADLNRGDVLLLVPRGQGQVEVVARAAPHSVPPLNPREQIGDRPDMSRLPAVRLVLDGNPTAEAAVDLADHRAHVVQQAFALRDGANHLLGVLTLEKSLVEHERHATRRQEFRRALDDLLDMVLRGQSGPLDTLSPFTETDGIMIVNDQRMITYVSGLGSYHYRALGYYAELIGSPVQALETADAELVERAFTGGEPFEDERREDERLWIRKVIPLESPQFRLPAPLSGLAPRGMGERRRRRVLITIHDATVARRKERERLVRRAMVQEIHHRVKNNLQTVASLLRIQARRAEHEETRSVLRDSINRILSIAVVHEFLSQHEKAIDIRDVAGRIVSQVKSGILDPSRPIKVGVDGDALFLGAHQTTMLALVINELLLNALEHGFTEVESGEIFILFTDHGDSVELLIHDTGRGLPADFNLASAGSLGLQIVQTIVQNDLSGQFSLAAAQGGTSAVVRFPKRATDPVEYQPI